ncbi:MAG TPA: hypothetical protein EYP14_07140, partial [Planctomycetaceae bacterium]|nr:hypothetical protein [Planctomycetaceae bacterium]
MSARRSRELNRSGRSECHRGGPSRLASGRSVSLCVEDRPFNIVGERELAVKNCVCLVLGGGKGTRLFPLTRYRSKPAVPLAGKYRLIDIP